MVPEETRPPTIEYRSQSQPRSGFRWWAIGAIASSIAAGLALRFVLLIIFDIRMRPTGIVTQEEIVAIGILLSAAFLFALLGIAFAVQSLRKHERAFVRAIVALALSVPIAMYAGRHLLHFLLFHIRRGS